MLEEIKTSEKEQLERLLEENIRLTQEIHKMSKRINRYVTIQHILSAFYFLLIITPLIIGVIYLPKFMQSYLSPYLELMGESKNTMENIGNAGTSNIMDIVDQAQQIINNK